MKQFIDETKIEVQSGSGGNGIVSFRREKYVAKGGPDGGDGGRGGDVIFIVRNNLKTLSYLKQKRIFKAKNGLPGGKRLKHGRDGDDVLISVPLGTLVKDPDNGSILMDLKKNGQRWVFLKGGRGGWGNKHFASATRRTPKFARQGRAGETRELLVELNVIADVGLVGFPNAGKSTLLSKLTNADPKIGEYPFTTTEPNLGVLRLFDTDIVIADIPGIIEGASRGAGLGIKFLKHISRTSLLVFLIDMSNCQFKDAVPKLERELTDFALPLSEKPRIIVGNKIDIPGARKNFSLLCDLYPSERVYGISSITGEGLKDFGILIASIIKEEV